ncbi:MAG: type I-E CRISPR-associated protein Cas6/Cse3/CasE [Proteobacteria bacterium]|nr:type I-E CRISPR-associated protein Cas6/Cse3/CasE [Pseudomonadota bacterium]
MYFSRIRVRPDVRDLHLLISGNGYGAHQLLWKLFPDDEQRPFLFREEVAREQIPFHKGVKGEPVFYMVSTTQPKSTHPVFSVESKPYAPRLAVGDHLGFKLRANPIQLAKKERTPQEIERWKKNRTEHGFNNKEVTKKRIRHDVVMDAQYHLLRDIAEKTGIAASGKKSLLKQQIIAEWQRAPDLQSITDNLKGIIKSNERFAEVSLGSLHGAKLLDLCLKSNSDMHLETWLIDKSKSYGFVLVRDNRLKFQAEAYQWHALPKKGKDAGFSSVDFEGEIEVTDTELFSKALFNGIGPAKGFGCGLMLVRRV